MQSRTHNFKVPGSFYHFKDNLIVRIIRASEQRILTKDDIVKMLESSGVSSRRDAKALASRVNLSELGNLHREYLKIKSNSDVKIEGVLYSRERNFVTIRYT